MTIRRSTIRRLQQALRGSLESFELLDGSTYYYDPAEAYKELFLCAYGLQLGQVGEPPELFQKLIQAKDPAGVLKRLEPESPAHAFVNVAEMYDRDALVQQRRLVPNVVPQPEDLSERT